ncbi:MAG: hypothetical protein VB878_00870 [Pirellulaceae bacterium]
MTWLLEESLYVLLIGVPLTAASAMAWVKTTHRALLWATILMLLLTVGGVAAEQLVVTDREQITAQLEQIAADVQSGDVSAILAHVHSDAVETRERVQSDLRHYIVRTARITKIHEILVFRDRNPAESEIKLNAVVEVNQNRAPIAFELTLRWEDERWKVVAYTYQHAMTHLRKPSSQ